MTDYWSFEGISEFLRSKDRGDDEKAASCSRLEGLGDPRAVALLIEVLSVNYDANRSEAAAMLRQATKEQRSLLVSDEESRKLDHASVEAQMVDCLAMAHLRLTDVALRTESARLLGEIGDVRATDLLIEVLKNDCDELKCAAADALPRLGDVRALEPLVQSFEDAVCRHRNMTLDGTVTLVETLAHALGASGDLRASNPLKTALEKAVEEREIAIANATAQALGRLGDHTAADSLLRAFREGIEEAVFQLARMNDLRSMQPLMSLLDNPSEAKRERARDNIESLLKCCCSQIDTRLLRVLATLPYEGSIVEETIHGAPGDDDYVVWKKIGFNCDEIKRLANDGLVRRSG